MAFIIYKEKIKQTGIIMDSKLHPISTHKHYYCILTKCSLPDLCTGQTGLEND